MRAYFDTDMDTVIAAADRLNERPNLSFENVPVGFGTIAIGSTHTIMRLIGSLADDGNDSLYRVLTLDL